jgi:predicted DNA-binding protein YlxM (UPF0122 family)
MIIPEDVVESVRNKELTVKQVVDEYKVSRQAVHIRINYKQKKPAIDLKRFTTRFLFGIGFTLDEIQKETGYEKSAIYSLLRYKYRVKHIYEVYKIGKNKNNH